MLTKHIIIAVMTAGAGSLSIGSSPQTDSAPAAVLLVKRNIAAWSNCLNNCTAVLRSVDKMCDILHRRGEMTTPEKDTCHDVQNREFERCLNKCDDKYL
jgi:hypothetical protein